MSILAQTLIIGATGGIGRALAQSIHAQNKKVIATGRNQDRLSSLSTELPGLEMECFDFSDIASLPSKVSELINKYPDFDTVIINAGIQNLIMFAEADPSVPEAIIKEVNTNVVAPFIFCQQLVPHFLKSKNPRSIIFMSSGLALVPALFFPTYSATKAAIHSFAIALRTQCVDTNITVTEVFPQYTETDLDQDFREKMFEIAGGRDKIRKPMSLKEFTEKAMAKLDTVENGKPLKEVPVGEFPEVACLAWREAMGPWVEIFGRGG